MIPDVRIGARRYAIALTRRPEDDPAEIDHHEGTIVVSDAMTTEATVEMVIHEILHGLIDDSGLDIDANEVDEEMIVRALAPRVTAFLADNPDQVRELLAMLAPSPEPT